MAFSNISGADDSTLYQTQASAASWGAIIAGAAAAAALALILLMLGTGLGLSSVSPWAYSGVSATTFGVSTILWLTFTQLVASGIGGYVAGRLRTRWLAVDPDEVYFRDTVHGFLSWAVAALATAALLTSVISAIVSGGVQVGATVAGQTVANSDSLGYFVDSLFRKNNVDESAVAPGRNLEPTTAGFVPEVTLIFAHAMRTAEALPAQDIRYVARLVSAYTGLSQSEAEQRVIETSVRAQTHLRNAEIAAKETADKGRETSAYAALWLFISLLIGAFVASFMATVGGQQRDLS
ncbi:MAG: hypothetical protein Q7U38_04220 [Methylobacter sp.]|nr:hypothetical protein [Methylobacter sp.]MDP2098813.1 hypothetical protein [Methylobacter sp.]MDP2428540.1 hypothetical protein [Methylobacter sp.]MDP3054104.1 hypothetical protein [Methylobacter sp.]MDP3363122.1 hypothetical protein [Methylobacter sp.]